MCVDVYIGVRWGAMAMALKPEIYVLKFTRAENKPLLNWKAGVGVGLGLGWGCHSERNSRERVVVLSSFRSCVCGLHCSFNFQQIRLRHAVCCTLCQLHYDGLIQIRILSNLNKPQTFLSWNRLVLSPWLEKQQQKKKQKFLPPPQKKKKKKKKLINNHTSWGQSKIIMVIKL